MMPNRLVITVGTSLFHSASWRCEGEFAAINGYERWCDPERLEDPSTRRGWSDHTSTASVIEHGIMDLVTSNPESANLVSQFEQRFVEPFGRYSAEITTLLRMRRTLNRHETFRDFLSGYGSIIFLHGQRPDPTEAAARHMAAVLHAYAPDAKIETRALEGRTIQSELKSLLELLRSLPAEPMDLVATGGYKAFGIALGHIYWVHSENGWRLFYLHESDTGDLVQEWKREGEYLISIGKESFPVWPEARHLR